jgi:hypothetical protein
MHQNSPPSLLLLPLGHLRIARLAWLAWLITGDEDGWIARHPSGTCSHRLPPGRSGGALGLGSLRRDRTPQ